eukprot:s179_g8.t2
MEVGQVIVVHLCPSVDPVPEAPVPFAAEVSPTAKWTQLPQEEPGSPPRKVLESQHNHWADDEIRFHLHALAQQSLEHQSRYAAVVKPVQVLDPLLITSWVQQQGIDFRSWAQEHKEVYTHGTGLITAVLLDRHWIPVHMVHMRQSLHVHTWDAADACHDRLNKLLDDLAHALGFDHMYVQRQQRLFFTSDLCGTLAIAYLRSLLIGNQLPTSHDEAEYIQQNLKVTFATALRSSDIATRPWIWGAGDRTISLSNSLPPAQSAPFTVTREQRVEMLSERGLAMGDDELRYHILKMILHQHDHPRTTARHFIFFEPLMFTCWDSTGPALARLWCAQNPQVLTHGHNVISAFCIDNHWMPIWIVPAGLTLQLHTFMDARIDETRLDNLMANITHTLGFREFAVHRFPTSLPEHTLCGVHALTFIAHVIMQRPLPRDVRELRDLHTEMRASFVAHLHSIDQVPMPVVWGNGPPEVADPFPFACACCAVGDWCLPPADLFLNTEWCHCATAPALSNEVLQHKREERLRNTVTHAMGDDEALFHLEFILKCYENIPHSSSQAKRNFVVLPPLHVQELMHGNATLISNWMEDILVMFEGQCPHILTVMYSDQHWLPVWVPPPSPTFQVHTLNDARARTEVIALQLGQLAQAFGHAEHVVHYVPHAQFDHCLCGAWSISFLAHIVLRTPLPTDELQLRHRSWNMKQKFVDHVHTTVPTVPVLWGWGVPGESGPLPIMPVWGRFEAQDQVQMEGECRLLPKMPDWGRLEALAHTDQGECRLLPIMPEWGPFVAQIRAVMKFKGECRLLPRMPGEGPFAACLHDSGECRLLPIMPEMGPFVAQESDQVMSHVDDAERALNCTRDHQADMSLGSLGIKISEMCLLLSHCAQVAQLPPDTCSVVVHGQQLADCIRSSGKEFQFIALLDAAHWYPVVVTRSTELMIYTEQGPHVQGLEQHNWPIVSIPNANPQFCGASALGVLMACCGQEFTLPLPALHGMLREFVRFYAHELPSICPDWWGFGPHANLLKNLAEELKKHGIPDHAADARAADAIKALGSEQILAALNHRQPWKQLKVLGNNARFQFVLPSELDTAVAANKGKVVGGKSKGKGATKSALSAVELDPSKLQVLDGTFACQGQPLPQILPTQIGPLSSGVVLMSHQDAEPYLRTNHVVSQEPLALLVLHKKGVDLTTPLPHAAVTVPCRCTLNSEPVLAEAVLVQLGTGYVEKTHGSTLVQVDNPDVVTLKILVYRDEFKGDWADFCNAPIRCIVSLLPMLKRCHTEHCKCAAWHNTEQLPIKDPIVDVWRRQFLRQGFKPCAADKAELYSVCLRIPKCILDQLLGASGSAGAYCEPRTPDARDILPDYTVIWTPKATLQEIQHLMQTNPAVSGLARLGERRGLRVKTSQAKLVHQAVRPDAVFLPNGPKTTFTAGPFPFGADRQAVAKILQKTGWECRPLQPTTPVPGRGAIWLIQATEEPPQCIIHTTCGDVMIAKQKHESQAPTSSHTSVGSASTIALCGAHVHKTGEPDPCAKNDPWGTYKPTSGPAIPTPAEGLHQIEARIQSAVMSKLQTPMEQDDLPDRVHALEGQDFLQSDLARMEEEWNEGVARGHPVPAQNSRLFHSAWRGVAILAKHPTRPLPNTWPSEVYASSRVLTATSLIADTWVTGGVVYGEPESSMYPHQKTHNEELLHHTACQICFLSRGPRYVAGDWNVAQHSLPVFEMLEAAGFRDLQDLAAERWGQTPAMTCKGATRRDFCYISRELQALLCEVQVSQDIFPDHAVLWGVFHSLSTSVPRQLWYVPQKFPWPPDWPVNAHFWQEAQGSCDDKYQSLWQHIEAQAASVLPFPVPRNSKGRASTTTTRAVRIGQVSPPKPARKGEIQPHYLCATFRHGQWLRQTRRLQSYVRHVRAQGAHTEYARSVWGSIIRSTGFLPSFPQWWSTCPHRTVGAPASLPVYPPPLEPAEKVFDSMLLAFRVFETDLHKASRLYARQSREANPNAVFQDLKTYASRGVDVLTKATTACIEEIRSDDGALVLTQPTEFNLQEPVLCQGRQLQIIHAEHDCVWVDDVAGIEPGHRLSQPSAVGTDAQLFQLFLDAWKVMWDRHRNVSPDRWEQILAFARTSMPRMQLAWDPLEIASLTHCISHKKSSTTGGLDGVSLSDLKAMPTDALHCFCDMFHEAEATGQWPTQVISGRVACLAKTAEPTGALDFRPITVFGLLYRCWGTYNARKAIRAIDPVLPVGLYGSRPHRYAGQVWSHLLWAIESAYATEVPLSGIVVDIQKAFNYLPRAVVLESCALLGIPFRVLRAWAGALSSMPRRFQINGSLSPPALSSCGLPEGCALSCLGMMAVDVLFHNWMLHSFPLCQPLSYVDDWQILVTNPHLIQGVFACLQRFVDQLDLFLDHRKTSTWSVSATGRQDMRAEGFGLVSYGRNLGAHVQFTRQHTNKILMERVLQVGKMWPKLRLSACAYAMKVRALKCAAWPLSLHGVAATTLSLSTFQTLRAGALKGLREDLSGASAFVHLSLVEGPTFDPHFWTILQTVRLARDCGPPHQLEQIVAEIAHGSDLYPQNSVTSTLLTRLQCLNLHVDQSGKLHDTVGSFSLLQISAAELQYRLENAWLPVVAAAVGHRPCFQGLEFVDPCDTRRWLTSLEVSDQALMRKVLNGTHFTQDGKMYCQESDTDVCPFCQCSDSRFHRFWECAHFEHLRVTIPQPMRTAICDLPQALTCSGWSLRPSTWHAWLEYFASLPEMPNPAIRLEGDVHLFTDGSCHEQHAVDRRFAGWAVISASTQGVHDFHGSFILDRGVLPGLLQSAIRAEIYALLRALQLSQNYEGRVFIWSDCDAVVRRFRRLQAGHELKSNASHCDLWREIEACLHAHKGPIVLTRVAAHQKADNADLVLHEWCFRHNELADFHAVKANFDRPQSFWDLHADHVKACDAVLALNRMVQNVQLTISQEVVRNEQPVFVEVAPEMLEIPLPEQPWTPLPLLHIPDGAVRWYGDGLVRLILSWFWQTLHDCTGDMIWVSHFQLYADFMCCTGHPGPVHVHKWEDGGQLPNIGLRGFSYKQRTRWFIKVWKESLRHLGYELQCAFGRPMSQMVLMHTGIVALPWPKARVALVDDWMLLCAQRTFRRQSKLVDALPYTDKRCGFPDIYLSTAGM